MKKCLYFLLIVFIAGCVKNSAPDCSMASPVQNAIFEIGDTVIISADATDEDGTISEVRFYIDDTGVGSDKDFPYEYHWYTLGLEGGDYSLKVMVLDNEGGSCEEEVGITLIVSGALPVADFTSDFTTIMEGDTVRFTDLSTNNPLTWDWDFGDGESSSEQHPVKVYNTAGTYTVSLEVSNTYGSDLTEKTDYIIVEEYCMGCDTSSVQDIDGTSYKTVKIGKQWWMAENLNATHYANGDEIEFYPDSSSIYDATDPGYTYYQYNEEMYGEKYGALYNWWAAVDTRNVCPDGWHVPMPGDWEALVRGLGGEDIAGSKLKYTGVDWIREDEDATNESGFTGIPSGSTEGVNLGYLAGYWTNAEKDGDHGYYRALVNNKSYFKAYSHPKYFGYSIRCVKDQDEE